MAGRIIIGTANPSLNSNADVAAGSTLTFYQNLTTTLATVYDAIGLLTPLLNPLPCDAAGQFPQVWAPSLTAYSVKWSRPGLADITYDNIFVTSDVGQALNYGPEINVAAAATTDLSVSTANRQLVIGNTAITSFGTGQLLYRILRFSGTPAITHNATSLILLGGANRQVGVGDIGIYQSDESGNWREIEYSRAAARIVKTATAFTISGSVGLIDTMASMPVGKWRFSLLAVENGGSAGDEQLSINTTSGAFTGAVLGQSQVLYAVSANGRGSGSIAAFDVTLTVVTTYFLNGVTTVPGASLYYTWRADPII